MCPGQSSKGMDALAGVKALKESTDANVEESPTCLILSSYNTRLLRESRALRLSGANTQHAKMH